MAKVGRYRIFYPTFTVKGKTFYVEYRQLSRTFDLYQNNHQGKLLGKYRHLDFVMLAIVKQFTGYKGDEFPLQHKALITQIEKGLGEKYQGLTDE